jgi:thiamine-monophosphate kinase
MNDDPDESFIIQTILHHRPDIPTSVTETPDGAPAVYSVGDDAALTTPRDVVTVDAMVEGVHFRTTDKPEDIGWKLVAINASDVAAMGCRPTWAVLTLSLPAPLNRVWVKAFAGGLGAALAFWEIHLVGGDTTGSPGPISLSMTMAGTGEHIIGRHGMRPGDTIWVTGVLGEAAAGFANPSCPGAQVHARPCPPVRLGARLAALPAVHAMMDLSDGLGRDLGRMCKASQVSVIIDPGLLPRGPSLCGHVDPLPQQVAFGEDYQLLFSAAPEAAADIERVARTQETQVTAIGRATHQSTTPVATLSGRDWPSPSWSHFGGTP